MVVTKNPSSPLKRLAKVGLGLRVLPLEKEERPHREDRRERIRMIIVQYSAPFLDRLCKEWLRILVLALLPAKNGRSADGRQRVGMIFAER